MHSPGTTLCGNGMKANTMQEYTISWCAWLAIKPEWCNSIQSLVLFVYSQCTANYSQGMRHGVRSLQINTSATNNDTLTTRLTGFQKAHKLRTHITTQGREEGKQDQLRSKLCHYKNHCHNKHDKLNCLTLTSFRKKSSAVPRSLMSPL